MIEPASNFTQNAAIVLEIEHQERQRSFSLLFIISPVFTYLCLKMKKKKKSTCLKRAAFTQRKVFNSALGSDTAELKTLRTLTI